MTELQDRKQEKIRRAHLKKRVGCVICLLETGDAFDSFRGWAGRKGWTFLDADGFLLPEFDAYFDLDHVDPDSKEKSISDMIHKFNSTYSMEQFDAELAKTQPLCTLDHRHKTYRDRKNGKLQAGTVVEVHVQGAEGVDAGGPGGQLQGGPGAPPELAGEDARDRPEAPDPGRA
jgi:hypothetical protein